MNRKVTRAVCHDVVHVPKFGQLGKTLSADDPQFKFRDIKMEWEAGSGLVWTLRGRSGLIPAASVFSVEFEDTVEKPVPMPALPKQSQAV